VDWKLRKQKAESEMPDNEPFSDTSAPQEPSSPAYSADDTEDIDHAPPAFFDLSNDAFKTDSRRTAIDHFGSPPWQRESEETPAGIKPSRENAVPKKDTANSSADESSPFTPFPGLSQEPVPPGFREDYAFPQVAAEPLFSSTEEMLQSLQAEQETTPQPDADAGQGLDAFASYLAQSAPPAPVAPNPAPAAAFTPPPAAPPPSAYSPQPTIDREAFAPGLVASEGDIPSVAPFIVDMPLEVNVPQQPAERNLVVHLRNLSATYPLTKDVTTIGRPDAPTQTYPDIEIELDDSVSRRHAKVIRRNDEFYLIDLGSTNGTLLNGQQLKHNVEMQLAHGDRIRIGDKTEITFE
jgi:hypothetical protein